jgi:hypothetical protein
VESCRNWVEIYIRRKIMPTEQLRINSVLMKGGKSSRLSKPLKVPEKMARSALPYATFGAPPPPAAAVKPKGLRL